MNKKREESEAKNKSERGKSMPSLADHGETAALRRLELCQWQKLDRTADSHLKRKEPVS